MPLVGRLGRAGSGRQRIALHRFVGWIVIAAGAIGIDWHLAQGLQPTHSDADPLVPDRVRHLLRHAMLTTNSEI